MLGRQVEDFWVWLSGCWIWEFTNSGLVFIGLGLCSCFRDQGFTLQVQGTCGPCPSRVLKEGGV